MNKNISFIILFFVFTVFLPARGNIEKSPIVEVTGLVRLVGNGPLTELVISGPDKEWYIEKEEEYKLRDLQYQVVTLEAEESVINLTFANGFSAGERRTLRNIKIITTL